MPSPFVDSASALPGEATAGTAEVPLSGRLLALAVVLTLAACSAALLVH